MAITDPAGRIVWQATLTPSGQATVTPATLTNYLRLPGQCFDAESGLHYSVHLYYHSGSG